MTKSNIWINKFFVNFDNSIRVETPRQEGLRKIKHFIHQTNPELNLFLIDFRKYVNQLQLVDCFQKVINSIMAGVIGPGKWKLSCLIWNAVPSIKVGSKTLTTLQR
jgi:hypothetical protein